MRRFILPTNTGYMIEWETGEKWSNGKPKKDSVCTKSESQAKEIKAEKERRGYKNVNIYECIY